MKPASTNWALSISTKLIQKLKKMKRNWEYNLTKILMISKLPHTAPSIQHLPIQIHTNLIIHPTNPQLTSLNCHFSSHQIFIHMLHSLTKHLSHMTLEGDTLLQLQKWWDAIHYAFWKYLSTNRIWPKYQNLVETNHDKTKFLLPPDYQSKYITAKENHETFSRALIVHLVIDTTVSS